MASRSPTQNSLKKLRDEGYLTAIVEHWNSFIKIRQDLFGIIDVIGLKEGQTLAVQCTSYSNLSARIKKIKESPNTPIILSAGWTIRCEGWHKKSNRWVCREVYITKEDL